MPWSVVLWAIGLSLMIGCGDTDEGPPWTRVEPGESEPGGEGTNKLLLGSNAFISPASNLDAENKSFFFTGNSYFNQSWVIAPASTASRDGLGPLFNARSCSGCHFKDGRGRPAQGTEESHSGLLLRISIGQGEHGAPLADPVYGLQIQDDAVPGVDPEAKLEITYVEEPGTYADGEAYTLRRPLYTLTSTAYGDLATELAASPRVAPVMVGLGLLEAIPETRLMELADPEDSNNDGISGRLNTVWDTEAQALRVGRFGWKAEQPSLRQQTAGAFLGDMGITTEMFPDRNCTAAQSDCMQATDGGTPEISARLLDRVVLYVQALAVPVRRAWSTAEVLQGKALFNEAGCTACHVPSYQTGDHEILALADQKIWPYTDLLLHDMGDDLTDDRPVYDASGREWRTPPLWGLGLIEEVNRHNLLLHDGRARGVAEAILWHGGEAEQAREAFRTMTRDDRDALVRFVRSL
ncbi:MAG: di-heme oxidoredictase family protein [Myxococcota bacterium]